MILRIGLDLEPGLHIARAVPDLDLLDIAYGAVHGGVQVIMLPVSAVVASAAYTPDLFRRPGLPVLTVKTEMEDLDRISGLGSAPDRIFITGERGRPVEDFSRVAAFMARTGTTDQEIAVLIEPEASPLKEISRLRAHWAVFSTERIFGLSTPAEMQEEIARLTSAALAASHVRLRPALFGPTGRHLPQALSRIPNIEEIYPTPDLWAMALRSGWEKAVAEYRSLLS